MVVVATTLQFVVNIAMPFSYNVYMFIVIRFLDGMCGLSYYHGAFIIGMYRRFIINDFPYVKLDNRYWRGNVLP